MYKTAPVFQNQIFGMNPRTFDFNDEVREMAQFEMVDRKLDEELVQVALNQGPLLGRLHATWGIGQRIRSGVRR